jgi:hypothetical protein
MAKNYSITFKSLRTGAGDAPYVVTIGGGTGTAIPLQPGEQPFTTQESDDEDMFCPIRTQTGYLRIVDNGKDANGNAFDWKDLIPATDTSRPVTLTQGGTTLWQGFMQAQDFGSVLYGNPQEREFPVQCVLSVLGGSDINYTQTAIQNFAYLLKQIVDAIPSACRPTEFYIQGGTEAQQWLLKKIDWQNFVSEDADGLTARFTMYQCLEDMCRFWGWTARTKGTTMYLTCADDSNQTTWLRLTYGQLGNLATYTSGTIPGDPSYIFETEALTGDIFASVNNDEYVQRGYNEAEVTADINGADDYIVEPFDELLEKDMKDQPYNDGYRVGVVRYTKDILGVNRWRLLGTCVENYASFNYASNYQNGNGNVLRIKKTYNNGNVFASFETKYEHSFSNGFFMIHGTVYRPLSDKYEKYDTTEGRSKSGNADCWIYFGVGPDRQHAIWWNGKEWVNNKTACRLTLGNSDDQMYTRWWTGSVFDIAIESNIINIDDSYGLLFVDILGSNSSVVDNVDGEKLFDIQNFRVEFFKNDDVTKYGPYPNSGYYDVQRLGRPTSYTYKSKNQNTVRNLYNADAIYGSDDKAPQGYGLLMNADYSYLSKMVFAGSSTAKHPEQHLADRVTNFWQTSRRRLAVELRRDLIADITPRHKVTIDGMTGYPIAISHEWRDDVTQLTILQL